ncbi:hypothetical protein L7F22_065778 [Adiantum nelumboides]|nr:hypothetical protein [Adiantum nelumboides]
MDSTKAKELDTIRMVLGRPCWPRFTVLVVRCPLFELAGKSCSTADWWTDGKGFGAWPTMLARVYGYGILFLNWQTDSAPLRTSGLTARVMLFSKGGSMLLLVLLMLR